MKLHHQLDAHQNVSTNNSRKVSLQSIIKFILISILVIASLVSSTIPEGYNHNYRYRHNQRPRNKRSLARHPRWSQQSEETIINSSPRSTLDLQPPPNEDAETPAPAAPEEALCGLPLSRLPKRIVPSHYDLMMMPNLSSFVFEGAIQIDIQVRKNIENTADNDDNGDELNKFPIGTNQIVLHADDSLNIDHIWYRNLGVMNPNELSRLKMENLTRGQSNKSSISLSAEIGEDTSKLGYIDVLEICRDPEYQLLVLTLAKDLEPNSRGQLYFTFSGQLSDDLRGFYKSFNGQNRFAGNTNNNNNNNTNGTENAKFLATTQLQATEARRAFPCFDEPALKATFDISLVHSSDQISLANMEPMYERTFARNNPMIQFDRELKLVRFARSPPMSTYLVAFIVGELEHIERSCPLLQSGARQLHQLDRSVRQSRNPNRKLRIRVYAPMGRSQQGSFALETACGAYRLLEEYCSIQLPMRKLDLVAIADFEAGAMENWGLVTFKDQQLLVDPQNTTPASRALAGGTVVHELAHHWFGNLVTLDWWNELWLNEGFATWFEHRIMEQLYPELEYQFHYLLDSHIHALNQDSFRMSHQVRPDVGSINDPHDIDESFDAISYNKAAAIIRSLHDDYLKPETFKLAIREYLSAKKFSTATTEELCHFMELANANSSHLPPVCDYMKSWLLQPGHPLILVDVIDPPENRKLQLSQSRFLTNVVNLTSEESDQKWIVLVNLLLSDSSGSRQETIQVLLENNSTEITLPNWFDLNSGHWLKLNANFSGFYRTLYPLELLMRFKEPVKMKLMSTVDRLNLVDETHALVLANKLGAEHLIELLTWLLDETHGAVLDSATAAYQAVLKLFDNVEVPNLRHKLLEFGRILFGSMLGRQLPINYLAESAAEAASAEISQKYSGHMQEIGRSAVLNLLVQVNHELALVEAVKNFDKAPAPHLRASFYTAIARNGSEEQHGLLLSRLDETESPEELSRLASALARAEDLDRLAQLWDWLRGSIRANSLSDRLDVVSTMVQAGPVGRQFVRHLLEASPDELIAMNQDKPVTSLIEKLCISSGASHFRDLTNLFLRQKNLFDWSSSRDYIKRLLDWQTRLQTGNVKQLEQVLDHYLMELPKLTKTTTSTN